jgi:hydrogenase-4 component E
MNNAADIVMVLLVLTNLMLLGLSRLGACIRIVAVQGVALGLLRLLIDGGTVDLNGTVFALAIITLKGGVFPWMLARTLRELNTQREIEPFIGYGTSLVLGTVSLMVCIWLGSRLPLPEPVMSPLIVPVAFFTIMSGLFLIVSRRKALTQVLGYLVLENGIYVFGVALVDEQPVLVELGILLDVFVAIFVMGIAIFHINREFDHIDTDKLSGLRS